MFRLRAGFLVSFAFFATVGFALAWTGPSGSPPNANVDAPINVGATLQTKLGGLWANGVGINSGYNFCMGATCITASQFASLASGASAQWATTTSGIYYSGGNVGIGTASPAGLLDLSSASSRTEYVRSSSTDYTVPVTLLNTSVTCANGGQWGFGINGSSPVLFSSMPAGSFWIHQDCVGAMLTVTHAGNVGIGTMNPVNKLSVVGGGDTWAATFYGLSSSNTVRIGTLSGVATIGANNNIGNAWADLSINPGGNTILNDAYANAFLYNSDERLKKDIAPLTSNLSKVLQIQPVSYLWKDPSRGAGLQIGFIAQQVQSIVPELVHSDASTTLESIDYTRLTPLLVGSVQELNQKIQDQQSQIDAQQKEIDDLKAEISSMKGN